MAGSANLIGVKISGFGEVISPEGKGLFSDVTIVGTSFAVLKDDGVAEATIVSVNRAAGHTYIQPFLATGATIVRTVAGTAIATFASTGIAFALAVTLAGTMAIGAAAPDAASAIKTRAALSGANQYDVLAYPQFAGVVAEANVFRARAELIGAAAITDLRMIAVSAPTMTSGTATTLVGVYVPSLTQGSTNNYAIYTAGTTPSYFGGGATIGGALQVGGKAFSPDPSTVGVSVFLPSVGVASDLSDTVQSGIGFGSAGRALPLAAVVAVTTAADRDTVGLAFYVHPSSDHTAPMVEALRITHAGAMLLGTTDATNMSAGDMRLNGALWIRDGMTAPSARLGFAGFFVDVADGDFKVRFGDGTTKTIMTDT